MWIVEVELVDRVQVNKICIICNTNFSLIITCQAFKKEKNIRIEKVFSNFSGVQSGGHQTNNQNSKNGSLNVILVVILPVAEMVLILILIMSIRKIYRFFKLKRLKEKCKQIEKDYDKSFEEVNYSSSFSEQS